MLAPDQYVRYLSLSADRAGTLLTMHERQPATEIDQQPTLRQLIAQHERDVAECRDHLGRLRRMSSDDDKEAASIDDSDVHYAEKQLSEALISLRDAILDAQFDDDEPVSFHETKQLLESHGFEAPQPLDGAVYREVLDKLPSGSCVRFDYHGNILYGSTTDDPQLIWHSVADSTDSFPAAAVTIRADGEEDVSLFRFTTGRHDSVRLSGIELVGPAD